MSRSVKFTIDPDDDDEKPASPPPPTRVKSPERPPELLRHHSGASVSSTGQPEYSRSDTPEEFPHATKRTVRSIRDVLDIILNFAN